VKSLADPSLADAFRARLKQVMQEVR
jgi:hypothetical protein